MNKLNRNALVNLAPDKNSAYRIQKILEFESKWRSAILSRKTLSPDLLSIVPESYKAQLKSTAVLFAEEFPAMQRKGVRVTGEDFIEKGLQPVVACVASEAGLNRSWHLSATRAMAHGIGIQEQLSQCDIFHAAGIDLFEHGVNQDSRSKSIWKQSIKIQQSLADCTDLASELGFRRKRTFKMWWFLMLEWTHALEKVHYDPTLVPLDLPAARRTQAWFQAHFGRTTFR